MSAAAQQLRDLRAILDAKFPDATPVPHRNAASVATGIGALDAILPSGGLPRGRLSLWAPGGGATAMLRAAAVTTARAGERVLWIDGAGTVTGAWWPAEVLLLKPAGRVEALRGAEQVLRAGGFALVVLTGVDPTGTEPVRLSRAASEGGAAFVAVGAAAASAAVKIGSRIASDAYRWTRDPRGEPALATSASAEVRVTSLGWHRRARVTLPVVGDPVPSALSVLLPDRRGVPARVVARAAADRDPFAAFAAPAPALVPDEPITGTPIGVTPIASHLKKARPGLVRALGVG